MFRNSCLTLLAVTCVALAPNYSFGQSTKFLPKDTEAVVSFNLRNVMDSKIVEDNKALVDVLKGLLEARMNQNEQFGQLRKQTGFDLFTDLDQVTIATNGKKDADEVMVVVEGKFNVAKVVAAIKEFAKNNAESVKMVSVAGKETFQFTPPNGNDGGFMTMANKNTMIMTKTKASLESALGKGNEALKTEVPALMKLASAKSFMTMVVTSKAMKDASEDVNNPQAAMFKQFIPKMKGMTMSMNLDKDLDFQVGVAATNEQVAKELAEQAKQAIAFGQLMAQNAANNNPQAGILADIASTLRASATGSNAFLRGKVDNKTLSDLISKAGNLIP